MGLFRSLFKSYSEKQINKIIPVVNEIEALADKFAAMSDGELRAYTDKLKADLKDGKTTDDILPEAFALVREADTRVLGKRPFRVQLMGGILLHQGRVAEMKTGEGKTLVATMPAYLNALSGKGVHIVTVNDYLAHRDSTEMGKVYSFLGLTTGLVYSRQPHDEKQKAYAADITYATNHELGFDYLRDNMAVYKEHLCQRGHNFAIVDEVDSILIDEARTPLIISGEGSKSTDLYGTADVLARTLTPRVIKEMDTKSDSDYSEEYFYAEDFSEPEGYLSHLGVNRSVRAFNLSKDDFFFDYDGKMASLSEHARDVLSESYGFTEKDFASKDEDIIFSDSGMKKIKKTLGVSLIVDDKLGSAFISSIGKKKALQFFGFEEADFSVADPKKQTYTFTRSGVARAKEAFSLRDGDFVFTEKDFIANEQARVTMFTKTGAENAVCYYGLSESDFVAGAKARTLALTEDGMKKLSAALSLDEKDFARDGRTGTYSIAKSADSKVRARFNLDITTEAHSDRILLTSRGAVRARESFGLDDEALSRAGEGYLLTAAGADEINTAISTDAYGFTDSQELGKRAKCLSADLAARLVNFSIAENRDFAKEEKGRGLVVRASGIEKLTRFFGLELDDTVSTSAEDGTSLMLLTDSGAKKISEFFSFKKEAHYTVNAGLAELTEAGAERLSSLLGRMGGKDATVALSKQGASSVERLIDFDYIVDEKSRTAVLTAQGIEKAEKFFGVHNFAAPECSELARHLNVAIRAHGIMKRDVDYIVNDGAVVIVDTFTGRLMPGRRYSDGLHQAIEAKEHVKIQKESKTVATITYQNYFRMYSKLSGMTGTALTEEDEFREIYGLDVVEVPTNKPMLRIDHNDSVYRTRRGKIAAIVAQIKECYEKGQPVLVGTVSVDKSEELSLILKKERIPHNVLNAKQHEKEAEIVASAGTPGAVTISTNMAGRGTDIMLGGNPEHLAKARMRRENIPEDVITIATGSAITDDEEILAARDTYRKYYSEYKAQLLPAQERVKEAGGLFIIGTERHESRRVDNQLRGRSGRQGDPGESRFYLSLEDDLLRLFGSDRIAGVVARLGLPENTPIDARILSGTIENAQKRIEASNFARRKNVLTYDDVMNQQRRTIYDQRSEILHEANISERIKSLIEQSVSSNFDECFSGATLAECSVEKFSAHYSNILTGGRPLSYTEEEFAALDKEKLKEEFIAKAIAIYRSKDDIARASELLPDDIMRDIEKRILLQNVDTKWMDHLEAMDELRGYVGLNSYAQRDPTVAYRMEGSAMFDDMINDIRESTVVSLLLGIPTADGGKRTEAAKVTGYGDGSGARPQARRSVVKTVTAGRNDLCPCGSGKKYKACCWNKDQANQ